MMLWPRLTARSGYSHWLTLFLGLGTVWGLGAGFALAQDPPIDPWTSLNAIEAKSVTELAASHRLLHLDTERLRRGVQQAAMEPEGVFQESKGEPFEALGPVVVLPHPNGSAVHFYVQKSRLLPDDLAQRFPEIQTYRGVGVDDPSLEARFELTPHGFHGMVLGVDSTWFINPLRETGDFEVASDDLYVAFAAKDHLDRPSRPELDCGLHRLEELRDLTNLGLSEASETATTGPAKMTSGGVLRTYRAAIAATGEYTRFHGGSVSAGMSAIGVALNRLNAVLRREVSLRLILVNNNDSLIFTDPLTDPYTNSDTFAMLFENATTLNTTLGVGAYDLGHVFGTSGGGVAALAGACDAQAKAWGVTTARRPVGDPFVVSILGHEVGHQLGANHIFNGSTGSCGPNRAPNAAYEPGSGSTIMSYAGICSGENLQQEADDYYNTHSFDEMVAHVHQGAGRCGTTSGGGGIPQVDAGPSYIIPKKTAFTLTGSGNARSYGWEQHDLGPPGPPNSDDGQRPLFRSYQPVDEPFRTFPRLDLALLGVERLGESLPNTSRDLTFRLTGRNNQGGVAHDEVVLRVAAGSGPFSVLEPTPNTVWTTGETVDVLWDVAGTDQEPVACESVDILFSADGGQTFDTVLAEGVPNVGVQAVTAPDTIGASARVKVACSDNIFFALSTGGDFAVRGDGTCVADDTSFCLQQGRFKVSIDWRDFAGVEGQGRIVEGGSSADSGLFYFFAADNWEMLVKVINGCAFNDHYWVFGAATTNVEYTLRVVDTLTGELYFFTNPLGMPSAAITDTQAFSTCP